MCAITQGQLQQSDIEESHVRELLDSNNGRIYEVCDDNTNDNIDYNVSEDNYLEAVHLSQNTSHVATEEVRKIVEKIKRSKYRLFQYRVVNLSERNISNPVKKVLTEADRQLLKTAWVSVLCFFIILFMLPFARL
ncbi:hypothetical protein C1645_149986 [Glomus cerebriforme]|uniref:Uncharacterized protein n=1 Tax=Glomus cerebriforme TaxID=658196 RepID=A0A397T2T4_9GLOM|nr:hypothetical protein C1645_149986 [Glomus cerebriforme]